MVGRVVSSGVSSKTKATLHTKVALIGRITYALRRKTHYAASQGFLLSGVVYYWEVLRVLCSARAQGHAV